MNPFDPLNLPAAVQTQATKLLAIQGARSVIDLQRAADRAEGFGLGIETLRALNQASIEALYLAFDHAATARQMELEL
ncbi:hypothetical protein ACYZTX_29770 [Pseudomonas sp. MDT1-17]